MAPRTAQGKNCDGALVRCPLNLCFGWVPKGYVKQAALWFSRKCMGKEKDNAFKTLRSRIYIHCTLPNHIHWAWTFYTPLHMCGANRAHREQLFSMCLAHTTVYMWADVLKTAAQWTWCEHALTFFCFYWTRGDKISTGSMAVYVWWIFPDTIFWRCGHVIASSVLGSISYGDGVFDSGAQDTFRPYEWWGTFSMCGWDVLVCGSHYILTYPFFFYTQSKHLLDSLQ